MFGRCPGCTNRDLSPANQRASLLANAHRSALRWRSDCPAPKWLGAAPADGYRTRANARAFGDPLVLGLISGAQTFPLASCPNQTDPCRALLAQAAHDLRALGVQAWAPGLKSGLLQVRVHAAKTSTMTLEFVGPRGATPVPFETLKSCFLSGQDIGLYASVVSPHHVGQSPRLVHVRGPVAAVTSSGLRVTPPAWSAQSPSSEPRLIEQTLDWMCPTPENAVLEIGCGVGPLARVIAPRVARYLGVDSERAAILDAQHNVPGPEFSGATFRVGDGAQTLRRLAAKGSRFDSVVFHGMRTGFGGAALRLAFALGAQRLVYWSPTLGSLMSDLAEAPRLSLLDWGLLWQLPGTRHALVGAVVIGPRPR